MRAVIQRVKKADVTVGGDLVGQIGQGMLVLLGVEKDDTEKDLAYLVKKTVGLRIFSDAEGKMNLDVKQIGGQILVVSQFTLLGNTRKGNRPSFVDAAPPEMAQAMYEEFVQAVESQGIGVATGRFRADMAVRLVNDGPVTILIDSRG